MLAMTPPMGWNTWNTFGPNINEELIRQSADAFVELGLPRYGYEYVVIDDCWSEYNRDPVTDRIVASHEKFPNGMKAVGDYIHSKGLKFGMYSCAGMRTCADYPGSFDHEFLDADTFAGFGVDFLKYDNCYRPVSSHTETMYRRMGMALRAWGRLEEALEVLDAVLSAYTQQKDLAGMSFIHWAKGGIFRLQGQFEEGIAQFKQAISLAKKAGDDISLAYGYCGLAGISRICGKIDDCVKNYKLAEKIFKKSEDVFGKAYTNCGMANGLRQQGKYDEALRHYNVADKLYSSIHDTVDLGFVKWGRADILKRKNKMTAALKDLQEAKVLFDELYEMILSHTCPISLEPTDLFLSVVNLGPHGRSRNFLRARR